MSNPTSYEKFGCIEMSNRESCDQCGCIGIEIIDIETECVTIFGTLPVNLSLCKDCKVLLDFLLNTYSEILDYLNSRIQKSASRLRIKTKREMR